MHPVSLRPSERLRIDETYIHSRLHLGNESVFNNHLFRSKVNLQFTRELSLRFIVDYNGLLPNPALFDSSKYKRIAGDLLFTYLLRPGTALYVGYTDRYDNLAFIGDVDRTLVNSRYPTLSTGRQLFIKLSYNFRP